MARIQKERKVIASDPAWEAMKSARRTIRHRDAVRESAFLSLQWHNMWGRRDTIPVDLRKLLETLNEKRIPFVLTGAQAIGGWTGRPRATKDVDILVKPGRNLTRAVNAVKALYPDLEVRVFAGVSAFFVPGEKDSVIDVTYPHRPDLAETLAHPVWVEDRGLRYRIPSLESALANKYGAMLTPTRNVEKRGQDVVDFRLMVRHSLDEGQQAIDLGKLAALGEKVWPGGGGKEILRLVEQVKAGRIFNLDDLIKGAS
jgi:Nucleotidyl transferase AbiEii toxin, Type IV TA system